MISFHCTCGQPLEAHDRDAGKMVECRSCGKVNTVPADTGIQEGLPGLVEPKAPSLRPSDRVNRGYRGDTEDSARTNQQRTSGTAVASLVLGCISLCMPVLINFVAIILGIVALMQMHKDGRRGTGLAIGGIVTGTISVLLMVPLLLVALLLPAV